MRLYCLALPLFLFPCPSPVEVSPPQEVKQPVAVSRPEEPDPVEPEADTACLDDFHAQPEETPTSALFGTPLAIPRRDPGRIGRAVTDALQWLAAHQDAEGRWSADGFSAHCPPEDRCTGPGNPVHEVGLTGLAILAFLGDGNTLSQGPFKEAVKKGCRWLLNRQAENGRIEIQAGPTAFSAHILATLALCEAFGLSRYTIMRPNVQRAVDCIVQARNPGKAWGPLPGDGRNDSFVTGLALLALASAKNFADLGLKTPAGDMEGAIAWLDETTDPFTGRAGHSPGGAAPAPPPDLPAFFSPDQSESAAAICLAARLLAGQDPKAHTLMYRQADLIASNPPVWAEDGSVDLPYMYFGSSVMLKMGGNHWKGWSERVSKAVIGTRVAGDRHVKGSWDPKGAWGREGGRVYSTAMMALTLEVLFRIEEAAERN